MELDSNFAVACDHAANNNLRKVREYLDAGGDPNRLSFDRWSLGHHCLNGVELFPSLRGHRCQMLRMLIEYQMDVNISPNIPILHCCKYPEEAAMLLDFGADANAARRNDIDLYLGELRLRPIFSYVRKTHNLAMMRVLLANGADLALTNAVGEDVETFARRTAAVYGNPAALDCRRILAAADFIAEVKRAGSWKAYLKAPRVELVRLRSLCNRGRAAPPPDPILQRLFANVAASTSKPARTRRPLPNEVLWNVLQFWRTERDG
jgi:hypothetical protein